MWSCATPQSVHRRQSEHRLAIRADPIRRYTPQHLALPAVNDLQPATERVRRQMAGTVLPMKDRCPLRMRSNHTERPGVLPLAVKICGIQPERPKPRRIQPTPPMVRHDVMLKYFRVMGGDTPANP